MKINLFCMGEKGYYVLKHINHLQLNKINAVISSGDESLANDYYQEIKDFCIQNKIKFFQRKDWVDEYSGCINVAISWRWLLPTTNTFVIHDSLVPKYRGFAPLISALCAGDEYIGVSLIEASDEYDAGDIHHQLKIRIRYPIKVQSAIEALLPLYLKTLQFVLDGNLSTSIAKPQLQNEITYSLWRNSSDYRINWNLSASNIARFIDSVGLPYDGAKTFTENNEIITILDALPLPDVKISNRDVGKLIFMRDNCPIIVCGSGLLLLKHFILLDSDHNKRENWLPNFRIKLI
jgi:methionyl-tRNA formyltransferase